MPGNTPGNIGQETKFYNRNSFFEFTQIVNPGDILEIDGERPGWAFTVEELKVARIVKKDGFYEVDVRSIHDLFKRGGIRINNFYDKKVRPTELKIEERLDACREIYKKAWQYGVSERYDVQFVVWMRNKTWIDTASLNQCNVGFTGNWTLKEESSTTPLRNAAIGDLIEFDRGSYRHWGVYIGLGKIVHLVNKGVRTGMSASFSNSFSSSSASLGKERGMIQIDNLISDDAWFPGKAARINNSEDNNHNPAPWYEIFNRAVDAVMEKEESVYSVTSSNCEHFVTGCRYSVEQSRQVQKAAWIGGGVLGAIALGIAALAAFGTDNSKDSDSGED